ncbi:MAG: hypothetical protein QOF37_2608 [Thermoleophilaceae bacterium]|nr:hypothetical protein [Thermoleophilaceae bacterium]
MGTWRLAAIAILGFAASPVAAHAQVPATLSAAAARGEIVFSHSTTVSGSLHAEGQALGGQPVDLESSPYPYAAWTHAASTVSGPDGSYSFAVTPDRNTRYRTVSSGPFAGQSDPVTVLVDELLTAHVTALPLGRVRLSVTSRHPAGLPWGGRAAHWFVAEGARSRFRPVLRTRTLGHAGGATEARAIVPVAAGRFRFFVCFTAPGVRALGPPAAHAPCRHSAFRIGPHARRRHQSVSAFLGRGSAPAGYPFAPRVAAARSYLAHRTGRTAFAVVDSEGRLSGVHVHRRFVSASVVKAMLLTSYLRKLGSSHRGLDGGSRSILYPMIHVSDNSAATAVWSRVGDAALYRLARRAGMTDFSIVGIWARAQISAADQAKLFFQIDRLLPRRFRGYGRSLLSGIVGFERWGIPAAAGGWHVLFKGGWRGTGLGQLVHQVARLERGRTAFSMAVMTDGDPSMGYGITTIQGVTARLLAHRPPRASAARSLGPGGG